MNLTGGNRVMLNYANHLHSRGHCVKVVHPLWPYQFQYSRPRQLRVLVRHLVEGNRICWFALKAPLLRVPLIRDAYLPEADIVIANSWTTAADIARLSPSKGKSIYFIHHYETDSGPTEQIEYTYRLQMHRLCVSEFTRHTLEKIGCQVAEVVPDGVDTDTFFPEGKPDPETVLMPYHPDRRKGSDDGLEVLRRLRTRLPGLKARLFGFKPPPNLPQWATFHLRPSDRQLRQLYSSSVAMLYPSRYEGFGLPPLEAMACGCPVVSTRVGSVPDYAIADENALLLEVGDIEGMTCQLERLLCDGSLANRLAAKGLLTVEYWSAEQATLHFEAALERALQGSSSQERDVRVS